MNDSDNLLIDAYLDGNLTAEQGETLQELLRNDPVARTSLRRRAAICEALTDLSAAASVQVSTAEENSRVDGIKVSGSGRFGSRIRAVIPWGIAAALALALISNWHSSSDAPDIAVTETETDTETSQKTLPPPTDQAEKIHVEEDVTKLWSNPVNGVRARLIATRDEFTLEHPTSLIMLFQNVGDKPVQLPGGVNVMPTMVIKGEQPYGKDHDFNAAVWISRQKKELKPLQGKRQVMRQQMMATPSLQPGDVHIVIINIVPVENHRGPPLHKQAVSEFYDVQRQHVRLEVTEPGEYVLKAVWKPDGLATGLDQQQLSPIPPWRGVQIDFPPIKVKILEVERQNGKP